MKRGLRLYSYQAENKHTQFKVFIFFNIYDFLKLWNVTIMMQTNEMVFRNVSVIKDGTFFSMNNAILELA